MTLDEHEVSDALHAIDAEVSPDFASRVRLAGRRRLLRRRSYAAAGAVAVGVAAVPIAVSMSGESDDSRLDVGSSPGPVTLYAAPPAAGSECNGGHGYKASPAAHRNLLFLPPAGEPLGYAYVRDQTFNCATSHVALTAFQLHGDSIGAGLVVIGPNAPTPRQDGREGPHIDVFGDKGHEPIDGQPATEFSLDRIDHTDAYWTEPDGGQWHAIVRDMSQTEAVALLNRMTFDGTSGTATLPPADEDGWTVEEPAPDRTVDQTGWVIAQWTDRQGNVVDLTVTQTPDRTYQDAIDAGGEQAIITVRGHEAVLAPSGGNGGNAYGLTWQEAKDVQVRLAVKGGTPEEIKQVAESLVLASPDDPRISTD